MKKATHHVLRRELRGWLGVLLVLPWMYCPLQADQKLGADWVETLLEQNQTLRNYRGGVVYEDSLRSMMVKSDSAHVRVGDAAFFFFKGVSYADSVRQIRADTLAFYERTGLATFGGDVLLKDRERSLRAASVQFFFDKEVLEAKGAVELVLSQSRSFWASSLNYNLPLMEGRAIGNTRLRVVGRGRDTLFAQADTMFFARRGEELQLDGNVEVRQNRTKSRATSASFLDSVVVLLGNPAVEWAAQTDRDSVFAEADRIDLHLSEKVLSVLTFSDSTTIASSIVSDSSSNRNTIRADSANISFRDKKLHWLTAWGDVQLEMVAQDSSYATMSGKRLELVYRDGKPDSLILSGTCVGQYIAPGGGDESQLGSETAILHFHKGQLIEMSLLQEAYCNRGPQQSGDMHVSGDFLRLHFDTGKLVRIEAEGAVKGHYRAEGKAGQ